MIICIFELWYVIEEKVEYIYIYIYEYTYIVILGINRHVNIINLYPYTYILLLSAAHVTKI